MKINPENVKPAEAAVLGAAIVDAEAVKEMLLHLTEQDFILPEHKAIYHGMKLLEKQGLEINVVTLDDVLQSDGAYQAVGGFSYIARICTGLCVNLESIIAIVAANAREKRLNDGMRLITLSEEEALPQIERLAEQERAAIRPIGNRYKLGEQIEAFIERLMTPNESDRIKTGLPTLDRHTGGLPKKSISIVGARPGVGKTDIMVNWSCRAIWDKNRVAVFTLEMPTEQLLERYAATLARVNYSLINQNRVKDPDGLIRIGEKLTDLMAGERLNIIDDVYSITGIVAEIARLKPDIVFIDYMGIVEPEQRYRDSRTREIAETTRAIKKAAKKYNCHICVLAQLTRDAQDREPNKADLAESGAQEQQFDYVMLLHRPSFHNREKDVGGHRATLIMDKNKYGEPARLKLNFDGAHQEFTESAKE